MRVIYYVLSNNDLIMGYGKSLALALQQLQREASNFLKKESIDAAEKTIMACSATAAAAGLAAGWIPGGGAVVAVGAATAAVWTMYIKINKDLGISMKGNVLKFIASAFVTNLAANIGGIVAGLALGVILPFIPGFGSFMASVAMAIVNYAVIYASAVLYIMLLTKVLKAKGSFDKITNEQEIQSFVDEVNKEADLDKIVKEGKDAYKQAKKAGEIK